MPRLSPPELALNSMQLGTGVVANLIRRKNWNESPLGPPDQWPQSLRTVVSLMLNSKFPMFAAWGPKLGFLYNDAYSPILAKKHPNALGQPFADVWWDIWPAISPIVHKAMAGESSYFENLPLTVSRKGYVEQAWFTFSYSPVYDESGKVAGIYCAGTETTPEVMAERQRTDENERLKGFFQQAPGIMALLRGDDHTFELANEAYHRLVGGRGIIGKPVREALPELEGQGLFELLDQVYSSGETYVGQALPVELRRRKGGELETRYVDFVYQPVRDASGEVKGIFIEGSDVTEAVQATQALRASEQQMRQLANTIPQMAWMADPDGYIHWYNDRFYKYTGTTLEQMKGWGWAQIHHPDNRPTIVGTYKALIEKGQPFEMTVPLRSATGAYRTFFIKGVPLQDSAGNIVQWFGTSTDIDAIDKAQEELRAANRRKDEFLAMLAHELRNPLAPISTAAELLKIPNLDLEQISATSAVIARQVTHMTELVDDLLDVSRVTRGLVTLQHAPVDINGVIVNAIEQVTHIATAKHQKVSVTLADDPVYVMGDRTRLVQIFSNILNNATRYTPDDGDISVQVTPEPDHVQVRIVDTGLGIEPDLLPHVFDLFTQAERSPDRSQGGLGLGLALVKSLVELHGGTVTANSPGPGKGSEFQVIFPRLTQPITAPTPKASSVPGESSENLEEPSILVVDDNVDAAQTLGLLLQARGYKALTEYTATDALKAAARHRFRAIILDIGLPDMDGYELARRLHVLPEAASAEIIALTGYGQARDRERSRAAGFSHHFVKPVDPNELLAVLEKLKGSADDDE